MLDRSWNRYGIGISSDDCEVAARDNHWAWANTRWGDRKLNRAIDAPNFVITFPNEDCIPMQV
jgi:hypothetical protein